MLLRYCYKNNSPQSEPNLKHFITLLYTHQNLCKNTDMAMSVTMADFCFDGNTMKKN